MNTYEMCIRRPVFPSEHTHWWESCTAIWHQHCKARDTCGAGAGVLEEAAFELMSKRSNRSLKTQVMRGKWEHVQFWDPGCTDQWSSTEEDLDCRLVSPPKWRISETLNIMTIIALRRNWAAIGLRSQERLRTSTRPDSRWFLTVAI